MFNKDKANCFGQYFASKCSLDQDDITDSNIPPTRLRTQRIISNIHFRSPTVQRELQQLVAAKATVPDNIPARTLKTRADVLCTPLSKLFALCFAKGRQLAIWKTARVVPVYKKKSKSSPSDYRPVSLLSILSKVIESIFNRSVVNFLEWENVLSAHQFGFRRRLDTADLLTLLQHKLSSTIANRGSVHTLAVDIAEAFDKVSHKGAFAKAQACGISGTLHTWLQDYLSHCSLRAVVCGQESEVFPVRAGVPEGSMLGPTLFVLYVNDCEDCLPGGSSLAVYADDTTLYKCLSADDSIQNASSNLQQAVDAVAAWGSPGRSNSNRQSPKHYRSPITNPPIALASIYFNNISVAEEDEIKLLGVTFDRQLSFRSHFRNVSSKANQRLHFFKKVAPLLNGPGKLAVYKGFVHPTTEYNCLVWMGASDTSLRQLDRVQRRALHLIGPGTYLPRLSHRRAVDSLCYIYKLHYLANSHPLAAMLPPTGATHTRPTRQSATERYHYQLLSTNPAHSSLRHLRGFPTRNGNVEFSPPTLLQHPPDRDRAQTFKANVHRHILHSS